MRRSLSVALAVSLTACASHDEPNAPPVLDGFHAPATVTVASSGNYEIDFSIDVHDADDAIDRAHVVVGASDQIAKLPAPVPLGVPATVTLHQVLPGAAKGEVLFRVSVLDARGAESAAALRRIVLQ
jgi:hypothetical protein